MRESMREPGPPVLRAGRPETCDAGPSCPVPASGVTWTARGKRIRPLLTLPNARSTTYALTALVPRPDDQHIVVPIATARPTSS
jgi:hypothetical protein